MNRTTKVVILGVNGQDGSFATEFFLSKGYFVVGFGRQLSSRWIDKSEGFQYIKADLADFSSLQVDLKEIKPSIIFNAAAIHGAANFKYEDVWSDAQAVNTYLTHGVLEYIRNNSPDCYYLFLSSSKVFTLNENVVVTENSARMGKCIYSITKNAATDLIRYYREMHQIKASVVWTFNHESSRRGEKYFISRIIDVLEKSLLDSNYKSEIYTLDFWCDWGDAEEYMYICGDIAIRGISADFILATGKTLWARDFVDELFSNYSLNYIDHFHEIKENSLKTDPWHADITLLKNMTGAVPSRSILDVCDSILKENHSDLT